MDHDQSFKNLFLDYPVAALELFAAEESGPDLKTARIVPVREEQLKERLGDRFRELDVPLLVEWPDGRREAVLFVLEEDTEPKNFSIHRLAHYCLDLSELLKTERVVPVVVFLRQGAFPRELHLCGDHDVYLSFRFIYCELARLPAENYLESDNIVARINLPNMAFPPEHRVDIYASAMNGLLTLEDDWNKQRKYTDFIDAYANLNDDEAVRYRAKYIDTEEVKTMGFAEMILEKGREEGRATGRATGREEGKREGESRILRRLLTLRFGELPPWVDTRLAEAPPELLERWGERLLDAASLDAVFDND